MNPDAGPDADAGAVIDASLGFKLLVEEEHSDRAEALLDNMLRARRLIYAPALLPMEILSALYQRARRLESGALAPEQGGITFEQAEQLLGDFLALPIHFASPSDLYARVFAFCRAHRLPSTYDPIYVVLAQMLGVELWTADRRLIDALGRHAPWVRWIGDYPLPETNTPRTPPPE